MSIGELFRDMRVSLLSSGDGGGAVRLAAVIAEAALKSMLAEAAGSRAGLGEMIGAVHRDPDRRSELGRELIRDLNWLNEQRLKAVHYKADVSQPTVDDGKRAADISTELISRLSLLDDAAIAELSKEAAWKASAPAATSVLKLDRATQRAELDDLLGMSNTLVVVLVDGEVGQGHDHFGEVIKWRLRAGPKGQWREHRVDWPAPSESLATRYATLVERVADELEVEIDLPLDLDPLGSGSEAWDAALAPLFRRLERCRTRLCLRHGMSWLSGSDVELVRLYLNRVWIPSVQRAGDRMLLAFELARAPHGGVPLGRAWRASRRERKLAAAVAELLETLEPPAECRWAALDELVSVSEDDLVRWFRNVRGMAREAAENGAREILATTRGGRFEMVVKRLQPMARKATR